jgi:hypothetical protein
MGMNSTDIFYDWSESIPHGIESECAWGVSPHRVRRIGISGSTMSADQVGVNQSGLGLLADIGWWWSSQLQVILLHVGIRHLNSHS